MPDLGGLVERWLARRSPLWWLLEFVLAMAGLALAYALLGALVRGGTWVLGVFAAAAVLWLLGRAQVRRVRRPQRRRPLR